MYTYKNLKRAARQHQHGECSQTLVILGDSATQFLSTAVQGQADLDGLALEVVDTDYDQIQLQVSDPSSELHHNAAYALLYLCSEKLLERFRNTAPDQREEFASAELRRIVGWWDSISSSTDAKILQTTFEEFDDGTWGNYGAKVRDSFVWQLRRLNLMLMESMEQRGNVFPVDLTTLGATLGRQGSHTSKLWYSARLTPDTRALPAFASRVIGVIRALMGDVKKCVVLDLDNTLWGGVVGDDGIDGIQLGELGVGRAHTDLQRWLKQLEQRGVLLAVCSKNEEASAREPFEKHPDMVLKLDDISCFVANWDDKATNIRRIANTLEIGLDSMVFLDDNPFERQTVRSLVPEVTVPDLPEDPAEWLAFLANESLFDTASHSEGDGQRTKQYRAEAGRREAQAQFSSFDDYLESLGMTAEAKPFDSFCTPRVAQLTQRSNQFNLRTQRYTESDIDRMATDATYITRYFTLRDRFGDHGLVSVIILHVEGTTAFVDTWLMSCRVLRRGMEEFVANHLVAAAKEAGCSKVIGEYLPTKKNAMVADLYNRMGFVPTEDGRFVANVKTWSPIATHVLERED